MKLSAGDRVSWNKRRRGEAKEKKGYLISISYDGSHTAGGDSLIYAGIGDVHDANKILELIKELEKPRRKR